MFWTRELLGKIIDAPWPLTKSELLDYVNRTSGDHNLLENIRELDDESQDEYYIEDVCPICDDLIEPLAEASEEGAYIDAIYEN